MDSSTLARCDFASGKASKTNTKKTGQTSSVFSASFLCVQRGASLGTRACELGESLCALDCSAETMLLTGRPGKQNQSRRCFCTTDARALYCYTRWFLVDTPCTLK